MKNRVDFYVKIRWNVDFITEEIKRIDTSKEIREMVELICRDISSEVLHQIDTVSDEDIIIRLLIQFKKFDLIIRTLDNNEEEATTHLLLTAHVGDMLHLINEEAPELLDKYWRVKK